MLSPGKRIKSKRIKKEEVSEEKNEDEKCGVEKKSHINENAIRAKHKSCRCILQRSKWSTNSDSCQEVSGRMMH